MADIKREVMIWFVCWCGSQRVFLVVFSEDSFQFLSYDSPLKDLEVKQFLFLHFFFLVHFCHSGTSSVDLFLSLMCVCLGSLCYFWSNCWNLLLEEQIHILSSYSCSEGAPSAPGWRFCTDCKISWLKQKQQQKKKKVWGDLQTERRKPTMFLSIHSQLHWFLLKSQILKTQKHIKLYLYFIIKHLSSKSKCSTSDREKFKIFILKIEINM